MRRLLSVLLLLAAAPVLASGPREAQLTWAAPTHYTNGQPIEAAVRAAMSFRVYSGACGAAKTLVWQGTTLGVLLVDQPYGNRGYIVTAVTPAGVESTPSAEGCKMMRPPGITNGRFVQSEN